MPNKTGLFHLQRLVPVAVVLVTTALRSGAQEVAFAATRLEGYLERAQAANPELRAFQARYEAARARIPQMSALPDPMLQVSHFVESVQTRTGPQENILMLSQRLPWFGRLHQQGNRASAEAEALWFMFQSRQLTLARRVSWEFFEYAFTGRAIELTQAIHNLLRDLEPIVERKVSTGGEVNALLRLKVEIGMMSDKLASLRQTRLARSARLAELLAIETDATLPWPEWNAVGRELPDGRVLAHALEAANPELQVLQRKIASADAAREIARLASYPDLTVGLNYIQLGEPVVNRTTPDAGLDPWALTVAVNLPVWSRKNQAVRTEARATHRAATRDYENRLNGLRASLRASLALLVDAQRRLALYGDELLGLAEQAVENSRTAYEGGRTGILEVIDSERSLLELQMLYWRAAADARQQRIMIQTLANRPILGTFDATFEK